MDSSRTVAAALAATLTSGLALTPAPQSVAATPSPNLLGYVGTTQWFSPNGDGVQDRLRVLIPVTRTADVQVVVRRTGTGTVVRRVDLGRLSRDERRLWRWNGRNDDGTAVRDGRYTVTVVAAHISGSRTLTDREVVGAELRRTFTPHRGAEERFTFRLSRGSLHPATPGIVDKVHLVATSSRYVRSLHHPGDREHLGTELLVRDSDGHVVTRWPAAASAAPRTWGPPVAVMLTWSITSSGNGVWTRNRPS